MGKATFSQSPLWFRLLWTLIPIVLLIIAYPFVVFSLLKIFATEPNVYCYAAETLETKIPRSELQRGDTYEVVNDLHDEPFIIPWQEKRSKRELSFYFYTFEEEGPMNGSRLDSYVKQCEDVTRVIGELYPKDFTYKDHLARYFPRYVVNEDYMIYEIATSFGYH